MKKLLLISAVIALSASSMAQEKNKKQVKSRSDNKSAQPNVKHQAGKNNGHDDVHQSHKNTTAKYSKNTPSKVSESFMRDYPNASNVTWTKNQGYWTAAFSDGIYRTSVRYSANGDRSNTTRRKIRS